MLLVVGSSLPAHALTGEIGLTQQLEFVSSTQIAGANGENLALCYVTRSFRLFRHALTNDILRYALSDDNCKTEDRPMTTDQMITAQSLDLIAADIPAVARNSLERNLQTYGLLAAVGLGLFAVIWRRSRSLLGYDPKGPMRNKAALRIVSVMCHAAKCDGLVGSNELRLIGRAAKQLTRRNFPTADIIHMADQAALDLDTRDYIGFGAGLRDREKDVMVYAALLMTMHSGRMLPAEYEFVTELAYGLGMPAEDFRRLLNLVFAELEHYTANP